MQHSTVIVVLTAFAASRDRSDSRSTTRYRSDSRSKETTEKPSEITPCAAMQCPKGSLDSSKESAPPNHHLEARCFAIACTDQERCFCNAGYVLLSKGDPSLGCVLPEDCPCAQWIAASLENKLT